MQGIFQKENTDKALKYGIYRHLPTYEKIIRNLVSFCIKNSVSSEKKKEKNKWFHGLGLSNVKDTVENYGGTMLVSHTKESYETMIQVPIREE